MEMTMGTSVKEIHLEVIKQDDGLWEVFVNGDQTGQYSTCKAAKAAARRRIPSTTQELEWSLWSDNHWMARVQR